MAVSLSPMCHGRPHPNPPSSEEVIRAVNVLNTGSGCDQSQKNFELIMLSVGLAAHYSDVSDPEPVEDVSGLNNDMVGSGFVWYFTVESSGEVTTKLSQSADGVILTSGVRVTTGKNHRSGVPLNLSFREVNEHS